jgi:hypothetical protein
LRGGSFAYQLGGRAAGASFGGFVIRRLPDIALLVLLASLLAPTFAFASADDPTDEEVMAMAGPRTCEFGGFTDIMPRQIDIPLVVLDPNILYEYCFKLPRLRKSDLGGPKVGNGFVVLQTANLGNTSCGTASVYMIRPNRKSIFGANAVFPRTSASVNTVQPSGILPYTPGKWRVLIRYETGCNKYRIDVTW